MLRWGDGRAALYEGVCMYQLLSGDGSLSRCMAVALWCFMLSRYSCWDTASTDARISSSSQSVRPETHTDPSKLRHVIEYTS